MQKDTPAFVDLQRRRWLKASLTVTGGFLVGGGYLAVRKLGNDTASMTMQLGWLPGSTQIGEIVAKQLGYYQDEGLDFQIAGGGPSIDGVSMVASGSSMLGQVSSSPSIMLAISQNIPIQCFAVALQRHPYCYFSLSANPVRSVRDLANKKIGVQPTGIVLLKATLAKANIPESSVHIVPVGADMSPLLTGQVDAITGWQTNTTALRVLGKDRVDLSLWDTGVHLYALPYYATAHTLETNFDAIVRFVRATTRGWMYTNRHRDEAADLLVKEYPNLNRVDERASIDAFMDFAFDAQTREKGWGTMDPAMWQEQINLYAQLGQFTNHVPTLADVITMRVLNATQAFRMRT